MSIIPLRAKTYSYNYLSADPGAGKTEWAIKKTKMWLASNSVMLVVPTQRLCDEIARRSGGVIRSIHAANVPLGSSVQDAIQSEFHEFNKTHATRAIVITDASFMNLKYRSNAGNWIVFKDEPKEPLTITELMVKDSYKFIEQEFIELKETGDSGLLHSALLKKSQWQYTDVEDSVFGELARLNHYLGNSDHFEVLFDLERLDEHKIRYSVYCKPELYAEFGAVYFMAANFEHSFIYDQWSRSGVTWHNKTPSSLRRIPSGRMIIHYLYDDIRGWSGRQQESMVGDDSRLKTYMEWAEQELEGQDYVYVINNKQGDDLQHLRGSRMPAECHGLNAYNTYTNVVLGASYLSSGNDERFYHYYGSSTSEVRSRRHTQYYVQQLTRTDIRNYDSRKDINVYVPTYREALDLLIYFKEAMILPPEHDRIGQLNPAWKETEVTSQQPPTEEQSRWAVSGAFVSDQYIQAVDVLALEELEPRKPKTNAERQREYRAREAAAAAYVARAAGVEVAAPTVEPEEKESYNREIAIARRGSKHLAYIMWLSKTAAVSIGNLDASVPADKQQIDAIKKGRLPWFSCGIFEDGSRLLAANCLGSKMIGFDFDGTDITDQQISRVMRDWEYLQYTTISHSPKLKGRRIRVIVPYNRGVTVDEHARIKTYFTRAFREICPKNLALDEDKSNPESKLFVPHTESEVKWVLTKNSRKCSPVNVEYILAQIPKEPTIKTPQMEDILWIYPSLEGEKEATNSRVAKRLKDIEDIMSTMAPHDRSAKAVKIGGMMKRLPVEHHQDIINKLKQRGVDDAALKQVEKYRKA